MACDRTNLSAVQEALLSQEGADVNVRNVDGYTPLLYMLSGSTQPESSIVPVVQLLCDHGADVSFSWCDKEGGDAVAVAERRGWMEVVKVLRLGKFIFV